MGSRGAYQRDAEPLWRVALRAGQLPRAEPLLDGDSPHCWPGRRSGSSSASALRSSSASSTSPILSASRFRWESITGCRGCDARSFVFRAGLGLHAGLRVRNRRERDGGNRGDMPRRDVPECGRPILRRLCVLCTDYDRTLYVCRPVRGGPCPNGVSTDRFEVVAAGTDIGTMEYIISESCLYCRNRLWGERIVI